jgi:hypothetical protein
MVSPCLAFVPGWGLTIYKTKLPSYQIQQQNIQPSIHCTSNQTKKGVAISTLKANSKSVLVK